MEVGIESVLVRPGHSGSRARCRGARRFAASPTRPCNTRETTATDTRADRSDMPRR